MTAIATAAPGREPAVERHQIAHTQHRPPMFATRSRPGDWSTFGHASDDDTDKAADKRRNEQRPPSRETSARHPVEQFRLDHAPLLPPTDAPLCVACSPGCGATTLAATFKKSEPHKVGTRDPRQLSETRVFL